MTAAAKTGQEEKITALYGRLSDDDGVDMESNSISNQRTILQDYARQHGYPNARFFYDDGVSGTTFQRPGFREMEELVEAGKVDTVIVKDLSRFGRNYLEVGQYLEIKYPTLGVKFIAIQENVDTAAGTGTEMMPFHNIFNEWYAAQTSKKIRQVWAMKSANGKRVGTSVPYGYRKDPENHEVWHIDDETAPIVRRIYAMCLEGLGPAQIANRLTDEHVLNPVGYRMSQGWKANHVPPADATSWGARTVAKILDNRQYTGCTVNFKSTTPSHKIHKVIHRPEEEWQIIPNTQEAIIDEDTWQRVHELRQNKRRPTKTGRKSLFSGLVYCPDCGAKLHFCASKSLRRDQEFFRCSNYKSGRGKCTIHFIRDVVLEELVLKAVSDLASFVSRYEPVFLYLLERRNTVTRRKELQEMETKLEFSRRRVKELDRLIARIYEDNALGRLSSDRYSKMFANYEEEQKELEQEIVQLEQELKEANQAAVDVKMLLRGLREFMEVRRLTPTIVNTLIRRIEVHSNEKKHSHGNVKVDIYFTAAGMLDMPSEEEMVKLMEEIRQQQGQKLSA